MEAKITLGGKEWTIPPLAIKQNRIIDPLIMSLIPFFTNVSDGKSMTGLAQAEYDALLTITYTALTRGEPSLKREEFEELQISLPELVEAFSVIAQQTGIFVKGESAGEAQAV